MIGHPIEIGRGPEPRLGDVVLCIPDVQPDTRIIPDSLIKERTADKAAKTYLIANFEGEKYRMCISHYRKFGSEYITCTLRKADEYVDCVKFDMYKKASETDHEWVIEHRIVEETYRGQGLGKLMFALANDIAYRITASSNPEQLGGTFITVDFGQPALAQLLIDPKWLADHGLADLAHSDGSNLGYLPKSASDSEVIQKMLEQVKHSKQLGSPIGGQEYFFDHKKGTQRATLIKRIAI